MGQRADAVDRADCFAKGNRAVGANQRAVAALGVGEFYAGRDHAALDQSRERHPRRLARGHEGCERRLGHRLDRGDAFFRRGGVFTLALKTDEAPAQPLRHRAGGAGAAERVEHQVVGPRRRQDHARQQRFRFLRRMQLLAVAAFEPFLAGAQRKQPIGAHLDIVVARLERFVVERIILGWSLPRRPDQCLVRVGEAAAAKIRHRVGFAPDDVVEDPQAEILEHGADAKDVVIGADHPQRGGGLHHAAAGGDPGAGEIVVSGETGELVPIVIDGVDAGIVGALEIALQLQIIGRVGEDEIDASRRQLRHLGNAIADDDARRGGGQGGLKTHAGRPYGRPATRHNHDSEL